jgi:hypothetical protein
MRMLPMAMRAAIHSVASSCAAAGCPFAFFPRSSQARGVGHINRVGHFSSGATTSVGAFGLLRVSVHRHIYCLCVSMNDLELSKQAFKLAALSSPSEMAHMPAVHELSEED